MQAAELIIAFLAGAALGLFFFGGLWWTVQKLAASKSPYLLSMASFFLRAALVVGGFYLIVERSHYAVFAALGGFIAARFAFACIIKPPAQDGGRKEASHDDQS